MEYNSRKIGKRIVEERKKRGWNQEYLANQLGMTRQTLSKMESGMYQGNSFAVGTLMDLCKLFDCEMGYLLCEYDNPTRESGDISKSLGISADSVEKIKELDKVTLALFEALLDSTDLVKQIIGQLQTIIAYDDNMQCASPVWRVDHDKLHELEIVEYASVPHRDSAMFRVNQISEELLYTLFLNPKFFITIYSEYQLDRVKRGIERADEIIKNCKKNARQYPYSEARYLDMAEEYEDFKRKLQYLIEDDLGLWNYWLSLRLDNDNPLEKYCPDNDKYCTEDERPYYLS